MVWFAAAGLALSALSAGSGAASANNQARVQAANQYQQNLIQSEREYKQMQQAMTAQGKQNTAIAKSDIQSLINTNFTAGLMDLQRAMQKQQTASDIASIGKTRLQALASSGLNAAASGTVGASVNAVASDIEMKMGEAEIASYEQNDMNTLTLDTQIRNLYQGYRDSQPTIDTSIPDIPGLPPKNEPYLQSVGGAMGGALIGGIGNMVLQNAKLNLGPANTGMKAIGTAGGASLSSGFGTMSNLNFSYRF